MIDETKLAEPVPSEIPDVKEDEGDPAPVLELVPIEDLDKVEKLLDVAMNTINTPNLPNIKAACMQELKQIDDSMAEPMQEAQEAYRVALAEWSAKRKKKSDEERKKVDEENRKRSEEARKRSGGRDSWTTPRDSLAQPTDPSGPSTVYPSEDPRSPLVRDPQDKNEYPPNRPVNGTIDRRI